MPGGNNLRSMKAGNKKLILRLLNGRDSLSRKELAACSGLTQAAVSKLTAELIDAGMIRETGSAVETTRVGRKEIGLSLCLADRFFLGIYAEINAVTFSVGTLEGEAVCARQIGFTADFSELILEARKMLSENDFSPERLDFIGICITGAVTDNSFGCWDIDGVKTAFASAFGLPVAVENNVKAFVLAETYYGGENSSDPTLFFKWGPGVGSALYAGGSVFSGDSSNIAEIGHYIVDPAGKKCRCGRYGCLETVCACDVIVREAGLDTLENVLESDDPEVQMLLDHKINTVAVALTNMSTLFSTCRIVFFGSVFRNPGTAEKLRRQMLRYNHHLKEEKIKVSALNQIITVASPAAVCADQFFFSEQEETA